MKNIQAGAQATIVDICSGLTIFGFDPSRPCVSVSLTFDFIGRVDVDKEYIIKVDVQKIGKKLIFTKVFFIDQISDQIILSASHTIAATGNDPKL